MDWLPAVTWPAAVAVVALYGLREGVALARTVAGMLLALREREVALKEATQSAPKGDAPIPPDLDALAFRESEPWAREQVRAALRDEYKEVGDWDVIRARTMTGIIS